jgi:hypothetical protein
MPRADDLLAGRVPVLDSSLACFYVAGLRSVTGTVGADSVAALKNSELRDMLVAPAGAPLHRLGVQMLGAMAAGGAPGQDALLAAGKEGGVLDALVDSAAELLDRVAAAPDGARAHADVSDLDCASRALLASMAPDFYKQCPALSAAGVRALGGAAGRAALAAATALQRVASPLGTAGPTTPPTEADSFARIARAGARAFIATSGHVTADVEIALDAAIAAADGFAVAAFAVITLAPRTFAAHCFSVLLQNSCLSANCRAQMVTCTASLIDAIASTSHSEDTVGSLLDIVVTLINRQPETVRLFLCAGALRFLQPCLLGTPSKMVFLAARVLGQLAADEGAKESERDEALKLVLSVLRSITPGTIRNSNVSLSNAEEVAISIAPLVRPDSSVGLQLACLHYLSFCVSEGEDSESTVAHNVGMMLASAETLRVLRVCLASKDAFVYSTAAFIARKIGLAVPFHQGDGTPPPADELPPQVAAWSIEQVFVWVGRQSFRAYRAAFRESLVTGRMLVELTDDDLVAAGVAHALHRRAILHAVSDLVDASAAAATADPSGSASPSTLAHSPRLARTPSCRRADGGVDVFISYRRAGGSDFAQLIKIVLADAGLNAFLDVENLGGGVFDESLWRNLESARTVVLVWTPGCFDRMLAEDPSTSNDFVRKEYALALKLKKLIVPVRHEMFAFPQMVRALRFTRARSRIRTRAASAWLTSLFSHTPH